MHTINTRSTHSRGRGGRMVTYLDTDTWLYLIFKGHESDLGMAGWLRRKVWETREYEEDIPEILTPDVSPYVHRVEVYLDKNLLDWMRRKAERDGRSVSGWLRALIRSDKSHEDRHDCYYGRSWRDTLSKLYSDPKRDNKNSA